MLFAIRAPMALGQSTSVTSEREDTKRGPALVQVPSLFVWMGNSFNVPPLVPTAIVCLMGATETRRGQRDGYVFETPLKG